MVGPGASGSCRWSTSNASSASARMVLRAQEGSGASGATEPFAAVGMELPNGMTNCSGGGPSHGASTRASCPRARSTRARPNTCPWTPPGTVRLYGQTRPMRTARPYSRTTWNGGEPGPLRSPAMPDALPALSLIASPGKRGAILDLAAEADRLGFAGIACPSLGNATGLCVSLAHVTDRIPFWTSIQPIYLSIPTETAG